MKDQGKVVDNEEPELPDLMATYNVLDVPRQVHLKPPSHSFHCDWQICRHSSLMLIMSVLPVRA